MLPAELHRPGVGLDERDATRAVLDRAPVADAGVGVGDLREGVAERVHDGAVELRGEARVLQREREGVVAVAPQALAVDQIGGALDDVFDPDRLAVVREPHRGGDAACAERRRIAPRGVAVARVVQDVRGRGEQLAAEVLVEDREDRAVGADLDPVPAVLEDFGGVLSDE